MFHPPGCLYRGTRATHAPLLMGIFSRDARRARSGRQVFVKRSESQRLRLDSILVPTLTPSPWDSEPFNAVGAQTSSTNELDRPLSDQRLPRGKTGSPIGHLHIRQSSRDGNQSLTPPCALHIRRPQKNPADHRSTGFHNKCLAVSYSHTGRPRTIIGAKQFHF